MQNIYLERQTELTLKIQTSGLDAMALTPGTSLSHLAGIDYHAYERPILVVFVPNKPPIFILPDLEAQRTANLPFPIQVIPYHDDPATWPGAFIQACLVSELKPTARIGVDPLHLRWLEIQLLERALPNLKLVDAQNSLASLRLHKTPEEISAMRKAVDIAQLALRMTLPSIKPGMTEKELASELTLNLYHQGSDVNLPFFPIVASGPNSANPHASPGDRPFSDGDLLIIDWGASYNGYISDLTRTFSVGKPGAESEKIAGIVLEANQAGRQAAQPGVKAHQIDDDARSVITRAGYGEHFVHRTGHGIGLEPHEAPYIHSNSQVILNPGMAFTVEPGIYLPGKGGVRIEDDLVITPEGAETLSTMERTLQIVGS